MLETNYKEVRIKISTSQNIYAHIHRPVMIGKLPGIVIVPGGNSSGTDYDTGAGISAIDIASLGFIVLHYDPSGRGKTGGKEDHWGSIHQQQLSKVVDYFSGLPFVLHDNIGILSFSIGIIIASGSLARYPMPGVKYLFDWEGPSNRFNITLNNTHEPLKCFHTSNEEFWKEREPVSFIGNINCGYFRYQAEIDHVQGNYMGHAIELLNKATTGKALWTKCNDNPGNTIFDEDKVDEYHWLSKHINHRWQILKYLLEMQSAFF